MSPQTEEISLMVVHLAEDAVDGVAQVLRSGNLRAGAVCEEFEQRFAAHEGARYGVAVNSGTAALHLAYLSLLEPGCEVLVPSLTFFATASMVVAAGSIPVFCDVDPDTFTIDVRDAERRVTSRTRAIVPVHIYGNVCDVDAVQELASRRHLSVIWDAAQAHGARWKAGPIGGINDAVCYSFYPSKNMTTGEGGMILTNDAGLAERLRLFRDQGQADKYLHTVIGYNYRLSDVHAAIGLSQLSSLDGVTVKRQENGRRLSLLLQGVRGLIPQAVQPKASHVYHQFAVTIDPAMIPGGRNVFGKALKARGVASGIHYPIPLHKQPIFRDLYGDHHLPVSESICDSVLTLPVHPLLTSDEVEQVGLVSRDCAKELQGSAA